jgi:hypothetical protein
LKQVNIFNKFKISINIKETFEDKNGKSKENDLNVNDLNKEEKPK